MIRQFDLQLFTEEKTERATPKKMRDAREKGQVVQSKELSTAVAFLSVFLAMGALSDYLISGMVGYFTMTMNLIPDVGQLFESEDYKLYMADMLMTILKYSLPLLAVALVVGVLMSYIQVGFLFTTETLMPKLEKINPMKGFKNIFSMRSLVELVKSIAKASALLYIAISYVLDHLPELLITFEIEPIQTMGIMWDIILGVVLRCALFLFIVAVFDYAYKRWKNNKDLMMSKQEIKDEYKQSEGDPKLKAKIKEKQRAFAMSRMMQSVPNADVVITNPTHFAIAIKYDSDKSDAPVVTAKGQDLVAMNIKRIATENAVPIVENKPLAQTLFRTVEIGQAIPPDLYEAVAEVLAYVYKLNRA
ncbi:MAG: flagellar biosynthesis protein FlhB [Clostridiales bacterium]|jgi:flagellar biosynthetic protein FlhB|nr:flagellar biosynthesis protein FlhB [Clostridiales bacterium]MDN5300099.1 flagellar biosynthesis protein FlhB [Clostridiales bacterium]